MFRKIIVPLSLPGLMQLHLVFALVSAFITQAVIGGGKRVYTPLPVRATT
jgi:ABC-type spermidine/putrescine transport system permease subunit I